MKMIGIIVFALILIISIGILLNSQMNDEKSSNTNRKVSYPVMSSVDLDILNNAYDEYEVLKQTMSPADARQQLIDKLNNEVEGVESATLGLDGYTIFIDYSDGDFAAVDTFELDETPDTLPSTGYMCHEGLSNWDSTSTYTIHFSQPSGSLGRSDIYNKNKIDYNLIIIGPGPTENSAPETKKALVLGPCYYEFDNEPIDNCINYLKSEGWADDEIDVKVVSDHPCHYPSDCMDVVPDDFFNLDEYGIILFTGHGTTFIKDNYDETNIYLQFCFFDNSSFVNNPKLQEWKDQKKLILFDDWIGGSPDDPKSIYGFCIRADLLREQMSTLPSSYVFLSTCYGGHFNKVFLDKGAKMFLGWDKPVNGRITDEDMLSMLMLMVGDDKCVFDAYNDPYMDTVDEQHGSILSYYTTSDGVVSAKSFYLPGWMDLTVTGIPDDTSYVRVKAYEGSKLLTQDDENVPTGVSQVEMNDIGGDVFTPGDIRIEVEALSTGGNQLAKGEKDISLNPGENSFQIHLSDIGELSIEFNYPNENGQFDLRADSYISMDCRFENTPTSDVVYVWENLGDESVGGFNYFKKQNIETSDNTVAFYSNGDGEDGEKIPVSVTAYLVNDEGVRELIGTATAEIEIYNPMTIYSICGKSDGSGYPKLGSGSSWTFYHLDHGGPIIGNSFYARSGDQIRCYCSYVGYMSEYDDYNIYLRTGRIEDPPTTTQLLVSEGEIVDGFDKTVTINI